MASSEKRATRPAMRMSPRDNVGVALRTLKAGEMVVLDGVALSIGQQVALGHKFAARAIAQGEIVVKYGCPIGIATRAIAAGEHVHTHNVATDYLPTRALPEP